MSQLVRMHGMGVRGSMPEQNVGNKGIGDTPVSYCDTGPGFFPSKTEWLGFVGTPEAPTRQVVHFLPVVVQRCNCGWVFDHEVSPPYSFTVDIWREGTNLLNSHTPLIVFRRYRPDEEAQRFDGPMRLTGSRRQWGIYSGADYAFVSPVAERHQLLIAGAGTYNPLNPFIPAPHVVRTTGASVETNRLRLECRVTPGTPNPTILLRAYRTAAPTTLWAELTTSAIPLNELIVNAIELGYNNDTYDLTAGLIHPPIMNFTDLQFWDEDKMPFGPYDPQSQGQWSFWDGVTERPLTFEGTWNGVNAIDPPGPNNAFTTYPYMQKAQEGLSGDYTKETYTSPNEFYTGNVGVTYDVYTPRYVRPTGGFPLVVWIHGGFFVGGDRVSYLDQQWLADLIESGYMVMSPEYRLASLGTGTKIDDEVRDCKRALYDLVQRRTDINTDLIWTSGHSAGGYLAIAMMLTENLADDGSSYHRDLRINGDIGPMDIPVNGCFTHAAPINLEFAVRNDVLEGLLPIVGGVVNITTVFKIGWGQSEPLDYSGMANLDVLVSPLSKPLNYVRGTGDLLIENGPWCSEGQGGHEGYIRRAYENAGIPDRYMASTIRSDHDEMVRNYDSHPVPVPNNRYNNQIIQWLADQRAALASV